MAAHHEARAAFVGALLATLGARTLCAQNLTVTSNIPPSGYLTRDAMIELRFDRAVVADSESVAVFIDELDVTGVMQQSPGTYRYSPRHVPLPSGESQVVVFRIDKGGVWSEVGRFALRVLTAAGFEQARVDPRVDISNEGQVAEGHSNGLPDPERATYQDFTFTTGLGSLHQRDGWNVEAKFNAVGVTRRERALRFGERGERAPLYDLSDYQVEVRRANAAMSVGHVSFGRTRHLIDGFSSRGVRGSLRLGERSDVSLAVLNGSSIAGWDNFVGMSRSQHRIGAATVGLEALTSKPGALRLEATLLDASLLPETGFNEAAVTDAETSRGWGARLLFNPWQRLRMDAGYTRSRYHNPEDPSLSQGVELVPVAPESRSASYFDGSLALLQNVALTQATQANLSLGYRHERVDPLYRALPAYAQADRFSNTVELSANVAALSAQATHARSHDNLDAIASILTTHTRQTGVNVALPLGQAVNGTNPPAWLPTLSGGTTLTHQFGAGLPADTAFDPTHVPDQVSTVHTMAAQWQLGPWNLGYQFNRSRQDNRQAGRERADFTTAVHSMSLGIAGASPFSVNGDVSRENALNHELSQRARTLRAGLGAQVRLPTGSVLAGQYSGTILRDEGQATRNDNRELRVELTQSLSKLAPQTSGRPAQAFVRFARQSARTTGIPELAMGRTTWTVNTGISVGFGRGTP